LGPAAIDTLSMVDAGIATPVSLLRRRAAIPPLEWRASCAMASGAALFAQPPIKLRLGALADANAVTRWRHTVSATARSW